MEDGPASGQAHRARVSLRSITPPRLCWQAAPEYYSGRVSTRDRVLQSALDCFTELGYDRTTITRIRQRSGVSNGALFHHFPNKEAIAEALYLEAMRSVQ